MSGSESDCPQLAELCRVLETLSKEEVRYMCVLLGVRPGTLSRIDANYPGDALTCVTKYIEAWLACDSCLSWTRVAYVLQTKRLDKRVLAETIRRKYCSGACAIPTSPSSESSTANSPLCPSSDVSSCGTCSRRLFQPDNEAVLTPPQYDSDNQLPRPTPFTSPSCDTTPIEHKLPRIKDAVFGLVEKFHSVVISANVHLTHKELSPVEFSSFKLDLIKLPTHLEKYKKFMFLRKKRKKIMKAESIQEVFDILDNYWNYVDYSLLEHIVEKYCDDEIKKQMKDYVQELDTFETSTFAKELTSVVEALRKPPKGYNTLTATLEIDAAECSLHHARKVKEAIAERASLEKYVLLLLELHASSVVIVIAYPPAVHKDIVQSLNREFLQELGITPKSLSFNSCMGVDTLNSCTQESHVSAMSESPRNIREREQLQHLDLSPYLRTSHISDSSLCSMPDPPQNVQEELIYTIRRCDLKPMYRESGSQLVQEHCYEIETRAMTQNNMLLSIQLQWKSDEIEFNIAGIDVGVATALQLIKELKDTASEDEPVLSLQQPPILTKAALQAHNEALMSTEVRQFSCRHVP